jgi:hypothetical protein
MMCRITIVAALAALGMTGAAVRAQEPAATVPIVAVTGCLAEPAANTWMLSRATDPVPSIANGPPANQTIEGPTSGKNEFQLIGVSEFDLPSHRGHTILVKGLFIKASPTSRVNVTSVTMVSTACAEAPK